MSGDIFMYAFILSVTKCISFNSAGECMHSLRWFCTFHAHYRATAIQINTKIKRQHPKVLHTSEYKWKAQIFVSFKWDLLKGFLFFFFLIHQTQSFVVYRSFISLLTKNHLLFSQDYQLGKIHLKFVNTLFQTKC